MRDVLGFEIFDEKETYEEYKERVIFALMDSTWSEYHKYEQAKKQVDSREHDVKYFYKEKEAPSGAAAEIGFCCG